MTLILTVNGVESIWMLADRRLSYRNRAPRDDARKVMFLETPDGTAILGYAGLGATALGTEPSDWMSAVLRGRNFPLEQSLGILADAMKRQFPLHFKIPRNNIAAHNVIVTSLLDNEARLYTIDIVFSPDRKSYQFRYTRWQTDASDNAKSRTPRITMGGTGGVFLYKNNHWVRNLLDLVNANDHRRVSANIVADQLAKLNYEVHLGINDKTVGPSCIVAWRHRKDGIHKGGGGHQFYTGTIRDETTSHLPTIVNGMDIQPIAEITMNLATKVFETMKADKPPEEINLEELDEKLARLPNEPDENLR
jgi:hypothetical protein